MKNLLCLTLLVPCVAYASEIVGRRSFTVPTTSMEPTVMHGDHVIVNELAYRTSQPSRGDIVVYTFASDPKNNLLKRIVGLPFETIAIKHKQLYVNGRKMGESYVQHRDNDDYTETSKPEPFKSRDSFGPQKLGMDEYFVLGDNRDQSMDSRYHGPVRRRNIVGKVERTQGTTRFLDCHSSGPTQRSSGLRPAALVVFFATAARRAEAAQL